MTDTMQAAAHELSSAEIADSVTSWLERFAAAIYSRSSAGLEILLAPDVTWRDFMATRWDFHHTVGREQTVSRLIELSAEWHMRNMEANTEQAPVVSNGTIMAFFDFTTKDRVDRGYVQLVPSDNGFVGQVLQTQVVGLQDFPERIGVNRPEGKVYEIVKGRTRWADDRAREAAFEDNDPAVLVLGAGHNGLAIAARLGALDVSTLVIDREARVGDQWRKRYAALALHSSVFGDHLPYMPLPPTWTAHTPKDKFADWLESYAKLMDLNVWSGTEFISGDYDEEAQRWTIRVRREDGTFRELHPRHFFVAGGLFAEPKVPDIKGLDEFKGEVTHSDSFQDGASYSGKRALVVGSGVSGHELAHDLYEHGADVTMLQRSATYTLSYDSYHNVFNPLFREDMPFAAEYADQVAYALPNEVTDPLNKRLVKVAAEHDKDLLDRLQAVGYKLEWGPDGTGVLGAHMSGRDSYQIDIGASQLIADRKVHLKQGVELSEVKDNTVVFSDGSTLDVDVIVLATGYHQFWGHIKPLLGSAASKVDKAYGRAADGEYANTWRRSAQPGLWFGTGFIRMARFYTKFSALLIKAIEEGIEPFDPTEGQDSGD